MSTPEDDRPTLPCGWDLDDEPTEVDPPREEEPDAAAILADLSPPYRPAWAGYLQQHGIR